ncbi:hypothetical protein G6F24_013998 [Rhizopus arrhizus]|nr:hypothetical protein G6F24_013998 [Rhizopus arrhizus]
MRQCAVPRIQVVIGHLVGIAGAAIGAGAVAQGQATDAAAHAHLYGVGVGLHEAGVADGVAGGDLVGADAGLGNGRGRHRGGQRVLLLVVVARRDVHADVARGTAEGIAAKRGRIGDASVLGDVAEPGLVDEHFGVGHADAEGRIRRRQRCGVVLRVVVAGHHVEAEIARRACAYAVADRGTVGDQAGAGGVVADRLAVVDHRDGRRIEGDGTGVGRSTGVIDVGAQAEVLFQVHVDAVIVLFLALVGLDVAVLLHIDVDGAVAYVVVGVIVGVVAGFADGVVVVDVRWQSPWRAWSG